MVRRRKRDGENSSLELLLDTMTNAFGGVLFLAILISIQLRDRSEQSSPQPDLDSEITRLETAREVLEIKAKSLVSQKELDEKFLEDYGDASDLLALEHLQQLREQLEELKLKESGISKEIERIQEEEDKSAAVIEDLAELRDTLEEQLKNKRAELENEKDKRTISGKLPRRKKSSKAEIALGVKFGRLYQIVKNGQYNQQDMDVKKSGNNASLEPKPNGGLPIEKATNMRGELLRRISANPATHYVAIALWPDSFEHFQQIKKHIVGAGFEYRLILMQPNESLGTGSGAAYTQ